MNLLTRIDMNVIITAHAKNEYGDNLAVLGQTFDGYKKLDYLFDLVIEIKKQGSDRIGFVKKSRIKSFAEGSNFIFNYENISAKYGASILEKESSFEVLATKEQVEKVHKLIEVFNVPEEQVKKWLSKAKSNSFNDMNTDVIQKCIDHLEAKVIND